MSIEVIQLKKQYGAQWALDDISFNIPKGAIVGFLGPNGAGKSTTMKIITGYISPSSGNVKVCGIDIESNGLEARRKIGYLPENNPLYTDMYVREYLHFAAGIYGISQRDKRVEEIIDLVRLTPESSKKIKQLSKGYRQRVGLAQALIHDPEVLILDEPTSGLDPNQLEEIRSLIREIGQHKTVLLSTHIMQEVEAICQRAIIIHKGKIASDQVLGNQNGKQDCIYVEFYDEISESDLESLPAISQIIRDGRGWLLSIEGTKDYQSAIMRHAQEKNWQIRSIHSREKRLNDVFKEVTN